MWCKSCQQDVPAIASPDESVVRCAKCHANVSGRVEGKDATPVARNFAGSSSERASSDDVMSLLDDWELEEDLNEAQRLVESLGGGRGEQYRADPAHVLPHSPQAGNPAAPVQPKKQRDPQSSLFSWCLLSIGLMAFVFGGVLLGWSFASQREDLWRLGMPFTLGGQAALILGLVFQLDGLSRSNREASQALDELDSQIDELRHATSLLSSSQNGHSQSFYLHMAEGASPKLLLADLKGQLDLLATRLAEERSSQ